MEQTVLGAIFQSQIDFQFGKAFFADWLWLCAECALNKMPDELNT